MLKNKKSPQSERLALFVEKTGYSVGETNMLGVPVWLWGTWA